MHHTKNLFRTKSQGRVGQADFEPIDLQQSPIREASLSNPPNFHLLRHFGPFHLKSTQNYSSGPSTSTTPIDTTSVQTTSLHPPPPLTNPPLVNQPLFPFPPIMEAWYAPLALQKPLLPLPNDY